MAHKLFQVEKEKSWKCLILSANPHVVSYATALLKILHGVRFHSELRPVSSVACTALHELVSGYLFIFNVYHSTPGMACKTGSNLRAFTLAVPLFDQ